MHSSEVVDKMLQGLESQIAGLRKALRGDQLTPDQKSMQLQGLVTYLSNVMRRLTDALGVDQELENKRRVYHHVARFLSDRFGNNINLCLYATYLLCKEEDSRLVTSETYSEHTKRLERAAKEHLITIKVRYEWSQDTRICKCKTEIFSQRPNDNKPSVKRVEEELLWENLPGDVREVFIKGSESHISYTLYP